MRRPSGHACALLFEGGRKGEPNVNLPLMDLSYNGKPSTINKVIHYHYPKPEDIADAVVSLARTPFATGQIVVVDGELTLT